MEKNTVKMLLSEDSETVALALSVIDKEYYSNIVLSMENMEHEFSRMLSEMSPHVHPGFPCRTNYKSNSYVGALIAPGIKGTQFGKHIVAVKMNSQEDYYLEVEMSGFGITLFLNRGRDARWERIDKILKVGFL